MWRSWIACTRRPSDELHSNDTRQCIAEIDRIIAEIKESMAKPAFPDETSNQMRIRADRQRSMATSIKLSGGAVKPEYE
jgi:hypothetical protein